MSFTADLISVAKNFNLHISFNHTASNIQKKKKKIIIQNLFLTNDVPKLCAYTLSHKYTQTYTNAVI